MTTPTEGTQVDFVQPTTEVEYTGPSVMDGQELASLPANPTVEGSNPKGKEPGAQTPVDTGSAVVVEFPAVTDKKGLPDTTTAPSNPNQF